MVVWILSIFLQNVCEPDFEICPDHGDTLWGVCTPLEMNLDDFTWILEVIYLLRKAKTHLPWNIKLASILLPFCYYPMYAYMHMPKGVFQHALFSGNFPRIFGRPFFGTGYCIFHFDSYLVGTYAVMRIPKYPGMLCHWGKLLNHSILEYNPELHFLACWDAQTW